MPDNRRILKRLSTGLIVVVFASLALSGYLLSYFNEPVSSEPVDYEPLKISLTEELDQRLTIIEERIMTISAAQQGAVERDEELAKLDQRLVAIEQQLLALIDEVRKPESVREVEVEVPVLTPGQVEVVVQQPDYVLVRLLRGDSIWTTLQRCGMKPTPELIEQVLGLNGISDPARIPAGTYLRIPVSNTATSDEVRN
jgi:hypothetical protein